MKRSFSNVSSVSWIGHSSFPVAPWFLSQSYGVVSLGLKFVSRLWRGHSPFSVQFHGLVILESQFLAWSFLSPRLWCGHSLFSVQDHGLVLLD